MSLLSQPPYSLKSEEKVFVISDIEMIVFIATDLDGSILNEKAEQWGAAGSALEPQQYRGLGWIELKENK